MINRTRWNNVRRSMNCSDTARILVVGDMDRSAEIVLELCIERDVTLCSEHASLHGISPDHRFTLNELYFENEIAIWLGAVICEIERTKDGHYCVSLAMEEERSEVFDDVLICGAVNTSNEEVLLSDSSLRPMPHVSYLLLRAG